jgi:hypothetical protein
MKPDSQDCLLDLLPTQVLRLHAAAGVTIHCNDGIAWVTQEGCARDDFLSAGKSLCIVSGGVTLVEAIGDKAARLTLRALNAYGRAGWNQNIPEHGVRLVG